MALIATLGYCGALVAMMHTMALPLLPDVPGIFGVGVGDASWVATSTLLAGAVANPLFGRLGDLLGKRRVMLACLVFLVIGSLLSAVASNLWTLVAGRALQGLGIGVIPLGIAVANDELPAERVAGGIALVSATLGIGGGIGLPLSGFLLDRWEWPAVFWAGAAMGAVALAIAAAVIPESRVRAAGRFDLLGGLWLSAVLIAFLLPISKSSSWGWIAPLPIALFAASAVGAAGWARYVNRTSDPVVDLQVLRRRPVMLANLAGLFLGFSMFNNFFASITLLQLPERVEHGFGADLAIAGLVMVPGAVAMVAMSPVSAAMTNRFGARTTLIVGSTVVGAGYLLRPFLMGTLVEVAIGVTVVNAGIGLTYGALPAVILANVPDTESASANAINALARAGGSAISSAAVAAILGALTVSVGGEIFPSIAAFTTMFVASAAFALAAAAIAFLIPRQGPFVATT